jgi:putative tributyrin esterase
MRPRTCCRILSALAGVILGVAQPVAAQRVVTDSVRSQALGVTKAVMVYLPRSYDTDTTQRFPVAIYLHGLYGRETDWLVHGRLRETMDSLTAVGLPEMIIVMPDGDDGWWTTWHTLVDVAACRRTRRDENADTYCVPWPKYDDYVARDLVAHVDSAYRTLAFRDARAIAGLSMGGYGAITLAARYPEVFVAAASHSGVLRPMLLTDSVPPRDARTTAEIRAAGESQARWELMRTAFGPDSVSWTARDPAHLVERCLRRACALPALYADVGTDDRRLPMSRAFRDALQRAGAPLEYAEAPGKHSWAYWSAMLPRSLAFLAAHLSTQPPVAAPPAPADETALPTTARDTAPAATAAPRKVPVRRDAALEIRPVVAASDPKGTRLHPYDRTESVVYVGHALLLDAADVATAAAQVNPLNGRPDVVVTLTPEGRARFASATAQYVGRSVAIVSFGQVLSTPYVVQPVTGGSVLIAGVRSMAEARALARPFAPPSTPPPAGRKPDI